MIHDTEKSKINSRYDSWFDNYGWNNVSQGAYHSKQQIKRKGNREKDEERST